MSSSVAKIGSAKKLNKRLRSEDFQSEEEEAELPSDKFDSNSVNQLLYQQESRVPPLHLHHIAKKPRNKDFNMTIPPDPSQVDLDQESDSDYDDLIDDFAVPTDMDDYLDDGDDDEYIDEDDQSTTSTRTTMSTGSVGSNTPSLVGENLESVSLVESGEKSGKPVSCLIGGPAVKNTEPPLKRSLFSYVPPSINFVHHNEVPATPLPGELRKNLRWKLSNITPAVVKKVVTNTGFRLMRKNCTEFGGTWGKHMKSPLFKESIGESQKINHFPGTFNIGRKDKLWKNYQKLRLNHGKCDFNFLPRTFCLPNDTKLLKKVWEKRGVKAKWIIKPPAMARGTGIKVVNKWNQIPKNKPLIVQRYIARPHLINNTKYDLRIYVLMTSLNPLRIYLYDEGLVRFASNEYTRDNESLSNVFMHLTNYSINKNSSSYTPNDDSDVRQGHKWTLGSLWQHFAENGIDQKAVWERIKDMVIKTIISAENSMVSLAKTNLCSHYCAYELFGFDVLLDADLKPWLIEVNISPSLHSASPLDLDVKSPLATEVFNIVRYQVPNKISITAQKQILKKLNMEDVSSLCLDPRLYIRECSKADKAKQNKIIDLVMPEVDKGMGRNLYMDPILETLTPDDVRCLIRAEDEMTQLTHFSRIFPTQETHRYFKYFQTPRYYNLLMDAWENKYGDSRAAGIYRLDQLCQKKFHLKVPQISNATTSSAPSKSQIDVSVLKAPTGSGVDTNEALPQAETAEKTSQVSILKKRMGVVSKPMHVKNCSMSTTITPPKLSSSPDCSESMSVSADSAQSSSEAESSTKSRSPSPNVGENQQEDNKVMTSPVQDLGNKNNNMASISTTASNGNATTANLTRNFNDNDNIILEDKNCANNLII